MTMAFATSSKATSLAGALWPLMDDQQDLNGGIRRSRYSRKLPSWWTRKQRVLFLFNHALAGGSGDSVRNLGGRNGQRSAEPAPDVQSGRTPMQTGDEDSGFESLLVEWLMARELHSVLFRCPENDGDG